MERVERVNAELQKQISAIIADEINDPRVKGIISVVKVDTARDLSYAKVYVSVLGDEKEAVEAVKTLDKAAGYVKKELKTRVDLRVIPTIKFIKDDSIAYGVKISGILKDIEK